MRKIQRIFREPRPEFHLSAKKSSQVEKDEIVRTEQIRRMDGPWPCAIQQTDLIFRFLESFHIWRKTIRTKPKPISKNVPPGENTSQQTLKCRWRRIRTETWENTRCRCGPSAKIWPRGPSETRVPTSPLSHLRQVATPKNLVQFEFRYLFFPFFGDRTCVFTEHDSQWEFFGRRPSTRRYDKLPKFIRVRITNNGTNYVSIYQTFISRNLGICGWIVQ